ncbi:DNA cytosine methyltransferase [Paenibacillus sp. GYB003]|uniref:DNA cytosine methyltransferase n=1 Tax=Paenibacillus sp. GYB003 TaxID=2994392 RepID=UPI002F96385D
MDVPLPFFMGVLMGAIIGAAARRKVQGPSQQSGIAYKTCAVLFGGIGGASAGFLKSQIEYGGQIYRLKLLCSIDSDPVACRNHDSITGENTSVVMDLFTREMYKAWHGHEPPAGWREAEPWDLWVAFGYQIPFFLFTSPPCKGLSALLPKEASESAQYQALNQLTEHGIDLALRACLEYGGGVPAIIGLENVPRIQTRGRQLLKRIDDRLKNTGFAVNMRADHNLGEIGGLGQNRLRFLVMARDEAQVPNFVTYPLKKGLKTIGEVLEKLPPPGDLEHGGPMHREPRLTWKVAMRLALIEAGKDWRSLNKLYWSKYRIQYEPRSGALAVEDWNKPCRTVSGTPGPGRSNGAAAVADYRLNYKNSTHGNIYRVVRMTETGPTVTGAVGPNNGAICVADPNVKSCDNRNIYRIIRDVEGATTDSIIISSEEIPGDNDRGVWFIIAPDGTRHRPLTTYELAILQGFDTHLPDRRPFQLEGCTDASAREYIGNAVPVTAAEAMGNSILLAAAQAEYREGFSLGYETIWVSPDEEAEPIHIH